MSEDAKDLLREIAERACAQAMGELLALGVDAHVAMVIDLPQARYTRVSGLCSENLGSDCIKPLLERAFQVVLGSPGQMRRVEMEP